MAKSIIPRSTTETEASVRPLEITITASEYEILIAAQRRLTAYQTALEEMGRKVESARIGAACQGPRSWEAGFYDFALEYAGRIAWLDSENGIAELRQREKLLESVAQLVEGRAVHVNRGRQRPPT